MNNDNKGGCLAIILGGILFILGPIVLILYGLFSAPMGLKMFLCVWIVLVTLCFAFIQDKTTKITISIIPTVIYAFSFASWYADDVLDGYYGGGGLGDTIGMFLLPFATLVPLMLIGNWIRAAIERKKQSVHQEKIRKLTESILSKRKELHLIDEQLNKRNRIDSFISLLSSCGAETNGIARHPKVSSIIQLSKERGQVIDEIKKLEDELNTLNYSM